MNAYDKNQNIINHIYDYCQQVAHRYGTVDNAITWDVIQNDIPKLREFCKEK